MVARDKGEIKVRISDMKARKKLKNIPSSSSRLNGQTLRFSNSLRDWTQVLA